MISHDFFNVFIVDNKNEESIIKKMKRCNISDYKSIIITTNEAFNFINDNYKYISSIVIKPSPSKQMFKLINLLKRKNMLKKLSILRTKDDNKKDVAKLLISIFDFISMANTDKEIQAIIRKKLINTNLNNEINHLIDYYLLKFGATPNLKGYIYLKEIISIYVLSTHTSLRLNNDLYEELSIKYNTSKYAIESAIRRLIDKMMASSSMELKYKVFSNTLFNDSSEICPSNSLFIKTMANKISDKIKKKLQ